MDHCYGGKLVKNSKQLDLLSNIEDQRSSRVITYITSDRPPPLQANIAIDVIPVFYKHLVNIGQVPKIDLYLYSQGGDTIVPWRLVNLVREFCDEFCVLIPYKAHSAATLIALGADEIVMGPMSELSPIDPSIDTPYNPPGPDTPQVRNQLSVEDVAGYISLARELVEIKDQDNLIQVLERLSKNIHPLALGAVYRTHCLIRLLASKLLELHMIEASDAQRIPSIVNNLAEKLYYHNYLISRHEAKNLGLRVSNPSSLLEGLIWQLYITYQTDMKLGQPFNPSNYIEDEDQKKAIETSIALIESQGLQSSFSMHVQIQKLPQQPGQPPQPPFAIHAQSLGWKTEETIEPVKKKDESVKKEE
jgi:hypothetical protein